MTIRFAHKAAVFAAIGLCGCGGAAQDGPPLVKVVGTVQLNGAPLTDASVAFIPSKGTTTGIGFTNESGEFVIYTGGRPGVALGQYRVAVTRDLGAPSGAEATTFEEMEREHKLGKKPPVVKFKSTVPIKYQSTNSSPLQAEVKSSDENRFEFKLEG